MFLSLFSFCETLPSLMYQGYKKWVATAHPATSGVAVFQIIDEHKFSPSLTIFVFAETLFPTRTLPWGGGGGGGGGGVGGGQNGVFFHGCIFYLFSLRQLAPITSMAVPSTTYVPPIALQIISRRVYKFSSLKVVVK